jgi:hypothetical protein
MLARIPAILIEVSRGFLQYIQANTRIVTQIRPRQLLPTDYSLIIVSFDATDLYV